MGDKLYKDCPKSYRLLCSKDDKERIKAALDQLREDHPEVFFLDDIYEPYCRIVSKRFGLYVLKDTGNRCTLADDMKVKRKGLYDVLPDFVLKMSLDHVFVYEVKPDGILVEIMGSRRRFVIDHIKSSDPDFVSFVHAKQRELAFEEKKVKDLYEEMLFKSVERDRDLQDFLERNNLE